MATRNYFDEANDGFIGYDKKKIKNAPRSAGWAKRVFDFFHAFLHVV